MQHIGLATISYVHLFVSYIAYSWTTGRQKSIYTGKKYSDFTRELR